MHCQCRQVGDCLILSASGLRCAASASARENANPSASCLRCTSSKLLVALDSGLRATQTPLFCCIFPARWASRRRRGREMQIRLRPVCVASPLSRWSRWIPGCGATQTRPVLSALPLWSWSGRRTANLSGSCPGCGSVRGGRVRVRLLRSRCASPVCVRPGLVSVGSASGRGAGACGDRPAPPGRLRSDLHLTPFYTRFVCQNQGRGVYPGVFAKE
jgi:hypothetical protein